MLTVGFVVTPGFPVMSLAALSVFEFANYSATKKLYDIRVLSEDGRPVPSASGTSLETTAFGDAHFDTRDHRRQHPRRPDLARPACLRIGRGKDVAPDCRPSAPASSRWRMRACSATAASPRTGSSPTN